MTCTRFFDTIHPKDKNKKYSIRFLLDFIEHIAECPDCYQNYMEWYDSEDNPHRGKREP